LHLVPRHVRERLVKYKVRDIPCWFLDMSPRLCTVQSRPRYFTVKQNYGKVGVGEIQGQSMKRILCRFMIDTRFIQGMSEIAFFNKVRKKTHILAVRIESLPVWDTSHIQIAYFIIEVIN